MMKWQSGTVEPDNGGSFVEMQRFIFGHVWDAFLWTFTIVLSISSFTCFEAIANEIKNRTGRKLGHAVWFFYLPPLVFGFLIWLFCAPYTLGKLKSGTDVSPVGFAAMGAFLTAFLGPVIIGAWRAIAEAKTANAGSPKGGRT